MRMKCIGSLPLVNTQTLDVKYIFLSLGFNAMGCRLFPYLNPQVECSASKFLDQERSPSSVSYQAVANGSF